MNTEQATTADAMADQTTAEGPGAIVDADRCVLCGLCLPHCPTYRLTRDENESPRGRISLIRAMATGVLPVDRQIATHLSRCLACRACERSCPSGVRYGRLIEAGRTAVSAALGIPVRQRVALSLLEHQALINLFARILRACEQVGLRWLLRASRLMRWIGLDRADALLPAFSPAPRLAETYPAHGRQRGRVALFTGCLTRATDANTITAAIRVLTRYGFDVWIPKGQTCCGGLHREAGDAEGAQSLLARNNRAFDATEPIPVIALASGCGAALRGGTTTGTGDMALARRVQDVHAFLVDLELPSGLTLVPRNETVLVHDPCSLRNGLRDEQAVYRLLQRIPGLRVEPLADNSLCCGGAGGYILREPEFADRLRESKLELLARQRPDHVVSANLGCALHLSAGLRKRGLDLEITHPLVLFERSLMPKR